MAQTQTPAIQESEYGRRLLTRTLDEIAQSTPDKLYATITVSDEPPYQFRDISFGEIAKCVNFLAFWLEERVGRSASFEALAFVGISDLRGAIFFHAAVKLGYKVLLLSHRNPPDTNLSLMEQMKCDKLFSVAELAPVVDALSAVAAEKISNTTIPSFSATLENPTESYSYDGTFDKVENDPVVIFHSSGSTGKSMKQPGGSHVDSKNIGRPKPIQMTHGTFATMDNDRRLANIDGRKKQDFTIWDFPSQSKFYFSFPPFHLAGFLASVIVPVFSSTATPIFGPPLKPPGGFLAGDIIRSQDVKALFVPPIIIEQLLDELDGIERFEKMSFVCYAGGPLSQSAGEKLKDMVDLCQYYGCTESSNIQQLLPSRENWAYMEWHPACKIEMQPSDLEEDTYEMVQFLDAQTRAHSPLNHNFPGLHEWRTKDLFKPNPKDGKLWRFYGRVDDIIVLSNGHKFNPVTAEAIIQEHPLVSGALIIGQGRPQGALLLELKENPNESIIDSIWHTVEQANGRLPGQGRLSRSMILVVPSEKRFVRTAKGTIVRKLTEKEFEREIHTLFSGDDEKTEFQVPVWQTFEEEALRRLLHSIISQCLPNAQLLEGDDFFLHGLDSLKTVDMIKIIRASLRKRLKPSDLQKLSSRMVYENPNIEKLACAISKLLNQEDSHDLERLTNEGRHDSVTAMATMTEKYSQGLERPRNRPQDMEKISGLHIALTGSTGSLGSRLLRKLVEDQNIQKIWCLNRSEQAGERFKKELAASNIDHSRVTHLKIDITQPRLGLTEDEMLELIKNLDIIVHNAWNVDFNQTLASFEDHIRGTRTIIDWCIDGTTRPRIVFISSVASVAAWPHLHGPGLVPDAPLPEYGNAAKMGYTESKLVAENILNTANERAGVPVSILRVGQIAPSTASGDVAWPEQEWLPSLIKTSKSISMIPEALPDVDWIPIDKLVDAITEISFADLNQDNIRVYNLVNPQAIPWSSILDTLREHCGGNIKVVPQATWLDALMGIDVDTLDEKELASKPALKILPSLQKLINVKTAAKYSTARGVEASQTLRELSPVTQAWLQNWFPKWASTVEY